MEDQLKKLKSKSIITLILALLAVTWQFISYTTIKEYVPLNKFTSFEVIIIYLGYAFLAILFLSIISLSFTSFRASMKYHSEKKKYERENDKIIESPKTEL